jgi:phosphate:Na+ symporter
MDWISTTTQIFGGLGLFLYGMKIMSEALQNASGEGLRNILWRATNNRFKGVITGFTITGIIQSSSATTVMLVSFVSAGLINLVQATGIILGANIGTTITGWIVALIGFKWDVKDFALPAIALGFFLRFLKNEKTKNWGEVLLGFGILFLGLAIMSEPVKGLRDSDAIMNFLSTYRAVGIFSTIMVVLTGSIITMIIQSSSATMSMTMILAVNGLIDFPTACALILGENIGTTITANIAAIGASVVAKRTAFVHMLFNVFGVIWVLSIMNILFIPFVEWAIPGKIIDVNGLSPMPSQKILSVNTNHMAAFHTFFNIFNMLIFLPFVNQLAKIAEKIIPERRTEEREEFRLKYISTALLSTPALNLNQARLEIESMMDIVVEMFDKVMVVFNTPEEKLGDEVETILTMENHTDILEKEISTFLVKISQDNISEDQSQEISAMLQRVNELERIGDHCESILKLNRRRYDKNIEFSEGASKQIVEISGKVSEFLNLIQTNISRSSSNIISQADIIEDRINELRKEMRKEHVNRLSNQSCEVSSGLLFIDMLTSFEKIGDHAYNIAESISGLRIF